MKRRFVRYTNTNHNHDNIHDVQITRYLAYWRHTLRLLFISSLFRLYTPCPTHVRRHRGWVNLRVAAAVWRTLWNGWKTSRRMQGTGGLPRCVFGCAASVRDSMEHYASCPEVADSMGRILGLHRVAGTCSQLADFLGMNCSLREEPGPRRFKSSPDLCRLQRAPSGAPGADLREASGKAGTVTSFAGGSPPAYSERQHL